jgi:hypothetical protein
MSIKATAGWKRLGMSWIDMSSVEISDGVIIKWHHELYAKVVNKFNIQTKTPSRVIHTRDNIKMDITEIGWVTLDWIDLAQDTRELF